MASDFITLTWHEAFREFLLHLEATRAKETRRFYRTQLTGLIRWAEENQVPFSGFGKRHLDRYLVARAQGGTSPTTLHHDAVCAKAFFRWCQKNDLVERSLLAEYEVRKAPAPARYMPTDDEIQALLAAVADYWNPAANPPVRYIHPAKRIFHRDRNTAILIGLLDSACRIIEMLSLKVDDYREKERQIVIRESKGRESRTLPVSAEWAEALRVWLRLRAKIMADAKPGQDEDWLFISEYGGQLDKGRFLKAVKTYLDKGGLTNRITLHSLRRYSLNRLAKANLLATQQIAGHKETRTTLMYTKLDPDFVRGVHDSVGVVRGILTNKRVVERRKRLL
jgi:site-specific recombinase XerD